MVAHVCVINGGNQCTLHALLGLKEEPRILGGNTTRPSMKKVSFLTDLTLRSTKLSDV